MRWLMIISLLLSGCVSVPRAFQGAQSPLVYDPAAMARAETIAIFIPGALTSVDIFAASADWEDHGYARALYRYPGLDDLPLDHRVDPATAAAQVAALANAYPDKPVALVGYSTGGPIAMMAAPQITGGRSVHVAAISSAVDYGGGVETFARGFADAVRALAASRSLSRDAFWRRYWGGLLYGPDAYGDPAFADRLAEKIAQGEKVYVKLDPQIALAHMLSLPQWQMPDDLDLGDMPVAFFVGLNDRVFDIRQTQRFARKLPGSTIYGYPDDGHLLFFTRPAVFDDVRAFVEDRAVVR